MPLIHAILIQRYYLLSTAGPPCFLPLDLPDTLYLPPVRCIQWGEIFDNLRGFLFQGICDPERVTSVLEVLRNFLRGSHLRDAILRYENMQHARVCAENITLAPGITTPVD